jgi:hypothetical protein
MNRIFAHDTLPVGTSVSVGNRKGIIKSSFIGPASNGGTVGHHTVTFTHRFKRSFGARGTWEALQKSKDESCNYSAINIIA